MASLGRFIGKVAVCSGASQGIGFATAKRLGEEGAKVVVSSRKQENITRAVKELKDLGIEATGVVCHQASKEDRRQLIDHALSTFGGIDVLLVNAGVNPHKGSILDITEQQWDKVSFMYVVKRRVTKYILHCEAFIQDKSETDGSFAGGAKMFDVNVKSVFQLIREVLPHMEKRGGGAIVTNSTANAYVPDIDPAGMLAVYAVSKMVQISMVKALAEPCADVNVRINAIAPGPIKTAFLSGLVPGYNDLAGEIGRAYVKILKRAAEPEECASVAAFLLSKDASFISGDCLTVCGGYSSRL